MPVFAANANLRYSGSGLTLTENSEGCSLVVYQDVVGVWTEGYGHTAGITADSPPITQEQAVAWLQSDLEWAEQAVLNNVTVPLTQGEFDALVDFVFNLGTGNFLSSTLLKLLNSGDYADAALQFPRWDLAGGKVVAGLLTRRIAEQTEFNSGATP
jgi:lysozyme